MSEKSKSSVKSHDLHGTFQVGKYCLQPGQRTQEEFSFGLFKMNPFLQHDFGESNFKYRRAKWSQKKKKFIIVKNS